MIRRLITAVAVTASVSAVVAGCSSDKEADSPAVAWSEQICKSLEAGGAKLTQLPAIDPSNPQASKDSIITYLGTLTGAFESLSDAFKTTGAPPVGDGQATLDKAMATITTTKAAIQTAKTKLQAAPVTDAASYQAAVTELAGIMSQVNVEGPTKDLKDNPELAKSFEKAPTCQKIGGQTPSQ